MKRIKLLLVAVGISFIASSCSLTEDGIIPQKDILKSDGLIDPLPGPIPPPPPPPPKKE